MTAAFIFLRDPHTVLTQELICESKYGISNEAAYMKGCKAFRMPETPAVFHEPVAQRFVNLPCALEVPPPFAALEFRKRGDEN